MGGREGGRERERDPCPFCPSLPSLPFPLPSFSSFPSLSLALPLLLHPSPSRSLPLSPAPFLSPSLPASLSLALPRSPFHSPSLSPGHSRDVEPGRSWPAGPVAPRVLRIAPNRAAAPRDSRFGQNERIGDSAIWRFSNSLKNFKLK